VAGRRAMNTLREALQEYLALRRGLGFKLHDAGLVLSRFVAFMEEHQASHITIPLALEWVQQAKAVRPAERARRLGFVRGFARYRSATDPLTEVPPRCNCRLRGRRRPCDPGSFIAFWVYSASRVFASPIFHQQAKGVAIACDGVGACLSLPHQSIHEE
jgi:hypothetical protein